MSAISRFTKSMVGGAVGFVYDHTLGDAVAQRVDKLTTAALDKGKEAVVKGASTMVSHLEGAVGPAETGNEILAKIKLKVTVFRNLHPKDVPVHKPPSLPPLEPSPATPMSSRAVSRATPSAPASTIRTAPSTPAASAKASIPPKTLANQTAETNEKFDSLVKKSAIYATLWMMHPAHRLSRDNTKLHEITLRTVNGEEGNLWEDYDRIFGKEISRFEKFKARVFCWLCHDLGFLEAAISIVGRNVLQAMRKQWAAGEGSKEPLLKLIDQFVRQIHFKDLKGDGKDWELACKAVSGQFLKPKTNYLEGLSWLQAFLFRRYFPQVFETVLKNTLNTMEGSQFRLSFMSRLGGQILDYFTTTLHEDGDVNPPTSLYRLPSLDDFYDALQLSSLEAGSIHTCREIIHICIQAGLDHLFNHPEKVEWMLTDLLEKSATVFNPPSNQPAQEELENAKNSLATAADLLLTRLIRKRLIPPPPPPETLQNLKTACEEQREVALQGISELYKSLEILNSSDVRDIRVDKFRPRLASTVDVLDSLVDKLRTKSQGLLRTHLKTPASLEDFDTVFISLYKELNDYMDVFLEIQRKANFTSNSIECGRQFDVIKQETTHLGSGEGIKKAKKSILAAKEALSKTLPHSATELTELDEQLRQIEQAEGDKKPLLEKLEKWAEEKRTFHARNSNAHAFAVEQSLTSLTQTQMVAEDRSVDSKSDRETTDAAISLPSAATNSRVAVHDLKKLLREPSPSPTKTSQIWAPGSMAKRIVSPDKAISTAARVGKEIVKKSVNLLIDDPEGKFYRAAARTLLNQYSQAR